MGWEEPSRAKESEQETISELPWDTGKLGSQENIGDGHHSEPEKLELILYSSKLQPLALRPKKSSEEAEFHDVSRSRHRRGRGAGNWVDSGGRETEVLVDVRRPRQEWERWGRKAQGWG